MVVMKFLEVYSFDLRNVSSFNCFFFSIYRCKAPLKTVLMDHNCVENVIAYVIEKKAVKFMTFYSFLCLLFIKYGTGLHLLSRRMELNFTIVFVKIVVPLNICCQLTISIIYLK